MMIMGGGWISSFQGWVSGPDIIRIKASYIVGVFCFAYLAFYGWKASSILKKQGIKLDSGTENIH